MNLNRLIETMVNEDGMVGPAVAQDGSTSIAYLPGGFRTAKNQLRSLSCLKKKWHIDVLEDANGYTVKFEGALNIVVPLTAYDEFNAQVLRVHDRKEVDLLGLVNEATAEEVKTLVAKVRSKLMAMRNNHVISLALHSMSEWVYTFKSSKIMKVDASINLLDYIRSTQALTNKAAQIYNDDVGGLEQLTKSLVSGVGIGGQELFQGQKTLAEGKILSQYGSISLALHTSVSMEMILDQHITADDERLLDDVAALRTVKVSGNKIYPTQSVFQPGFFSTLKKLVDDVEDLR